MAPSRIADGLCAHLGSSHDVHMMSLVSSHRIIEQFGLEGTLEDHIVLFPCNGKRHLLLDQIAESLLQPDFQHFL